jgi:hypothetical protein
MMTLQEFLAHVKMMIANPQRVMDWGGYAYGFLDFPELKEWELYDLAWVLSHPTSGYCSKGDIEGLVELIEKELEKTQ